jgi:hypothetical protein
MSRIFFFWKGVGDVSFLFFILSKGGCECFLFYFGSWVAFLVMTHFCFALVCKLVVKIQSSFILFTYMGESDGQNMFLIEANFCFWFSLQGGHGGPKGVFLVHHVDRTLKVNFCFGLVCKVVVEVQRSSILFTCIMGVQHVQKPRDFFWFLILLTFFMISFLSFHVILFFFPLITSSLCYGETKSFRKFEFFHLDQCQLVGYVNNF